MASHLLLGLVTTLPFFSTVHAQTIPLTGTWTTKSNTTITGPGFFNPSADSFIEPSLPGISYSFTADGYYEEAYYRAIANPTTPTCPQGIMQWQHGSWVQNENGSLSLSPISVDGRQLFSDPCTSSTAVYTRYDQAEYFSWYETLIDPYHQVPRLNLYAFDGSPLPPMYQVYNPPQMLPTTTLMPTATSSGGKVKRTAAAEDLRESGITKRNLKLEDYVTGINKNRIPSHWALDADRWWWFGIGLTGVGSVLYFCF